MTETNQGAEKQPDQMSRRNFLGLDRLRRMSQSQEEVILDEVTQDRLPTESLDSELSAKQNPADIIHRISEKIIVSRRTVLFLSLIGGFVGIADYMTNGLVRKMLANMTDGAFWTKLFESIENGTLDEDIQQLLESVELKKERRFYLGEEQPQLVDSSLPVDYEVYSALPVLGKESSTPQLIAVVDVASGTAEPYAIETEVLNGSRFALADTLLASEPDASFMILPGVHLREGGTKTLFPAEYRSPTDRDNSVEYPTRSAVVALSTGEVIVMTADEAIAFLNNPENNSNWQAFEMCLATIDSDNLDQDLKKMTAESVVSGKDLLLTPNHTGALATFYEENGTPHTLALGTHFTEVDGQVSGSLGGRSGISMLDIVYLCQDLAEKKNFARFVISYSDPGAQDNLKLISGATRVNPDRSQLRSDSLNYPYELISGQAIPREFRTSEKFTTFFRQLIGETQYGTQLVQQRGILVRLK